MHSCSCDEKIIPGRSPTLQEFRAALEGALGNASIDTICGNTVSATKQMVGTWLSSIGRWTDSWLEKVEFCDEFIHDDLRKIEVACQACEGCDQVYNLAADILLDRYSRNVWNRI